MVKPFLETLPYALRGNGVQIAVRKDLIDDEDVRCLSLHWKG